LGASPILTRLYTPEEFGVLAVFASIIGVVFAFIAGRYEMAIPLPDREEQAASLTVAGYIVVLFLSLISGIGLFFGGQQIVQWTNTPNLEPYLWLIPVGLVGAGTYQVLNYWAVRHKAYSVIARTKVTQNAARVGSQVSIGLLSSGPLGLLVGEVLGRVGGVGSLALFTIRETMSEFKTVSARGVVKAARRYRRFPMLAAPSALLNKASTNLPALLFASIFSPAVAGWFALSQRVIGLPVWLVSQAVSQVYLGEAAEIRQKSPAELRGLFIRLSALLLAVGLIPALALGAFGDVIFSFVFGADWTEAGQYAEYLSVAFLAQIIVVPLSMTLNILEQQGLQLAWDAARFVIVLGALWGAYQYRVDPSYAVGLFSVSLVLTYVLLWGLSLRAVSKHTLQDA
jgi:O-antigen/teichoic acid export membrane protein